MTSRMRWLLVIGMMLVIVVGCLSLILPSRAQPSVTVNAHPPVRRAPSVPMSFLQPVSVDQLNQFLTAARHAETISDPLKRCLAYPDPPNLDWSKDVTSAYCHYQFDPAVTPGDVRRLIQDGHVQELERRLSDAMDAQLAQPGTPGLLDRTYNFDFKNGSQEMRALMDAWKRQSPTNPFALAASGTAYVQMAQEMRGTDAASKTPQSSFESMNRLLQLARADLDQAVALQPHLTAAYTAMIYAATLDGDEPYASNAAQRALAVDPANYGIYARLVWMAQPKWGGSVESMQRLIAASQRHAAANPLLKLLNSEKGGGEAYVENCACNPVAELRLYHQVYAEAATVNMLMSGGWAAKNRNDPELSVIYRSEVLRFAPEQLAHRQGRAFDLPSLGQADWALAEGNALVALAPQDENSFDVRGLAHEATGDFVHAIDDYEQALRINPTDTWTLAALGNLYIHSSHDWDKAWSVANRLIQLDPDNSQGWILRARVQKDQPRDGLEQTISDFSTRAGNDPSQQAALMQMRAMHSK